MGGRKKEHHGTFANESVLIAKKIACHAKADPTGEKFLKYMRHVSVIRKGASTSRNRSLWTDLREHGALSSIMDALQNVLASEDIRKLSVVDNGNQRNVSKIELERIDRIVNICNMGFGILSNAFALDYAVRSEAVENGFISTLQKFIANFTEDFYITFKNAELISRAVKCTANISNDPTCREIVLRNGVAISILKILDKVNEKMSSEASNDDGASFVDRTDISQLISACMRAVRIMASDSKYLMNQGRDHLIKFGGLITVINTLGWEAKLTNDDDFVLDVVRALTLLSVRIRSAPFDVVQTLILTHNPDCSKVRSLVKLFENSLPDSKLYTPLVNCLINFCTNKEINDCLGGLRIFHVILSKLSDLSDEEHYHDLIKLMIALTRNSSFNQSHLATSPLIGSTLKILKSSHFKDYHEWLLMVYENLYEVSLSKLVQDDLVNYLSELLRDEIEDCDYDALRKKISSLDDPKCSVHCGDNSCPFVPAYRCSSPSYKQIQEEMKSRLPVEDCAFPSSCLKKGEDSLSPLSSPAHSWASGGSSPVHSDVSFASYSSFSEDGGCYSVDAHSPIATSDEEMDREETLMDTQDDDDAQDPPVKKQKSEFGTAVITAQFSRTSTMIKREKSLVELKASAKKIVGILNILYKCTHVKPFPESILNIAPILLGIILRGKVSLMPQGIAYQNVQKDEELQELSRRTFEIANKVLLRVCSVSQIFPEIIKSGMIPILHRLQEPFTSTPNVSDSVTVVQKYCKNILSKMVGLENDTAGWRQGFIMRTVLVNNSNISKENMDQMVVNIPLLYQNHVSILRSFESTARSFTKILDLLKDSDEASFYRFEDCALALCSICSALGVKWTAPADNVPLLLNTSCSKDNDKVIILSSCESESLAEDKTESLGEIERVKLVLDDDAVFLVQKDLLVDASPVFSAMFNGSFIEANEQKVHLPQVSKTSVRLLLDQILILRDVVSNNEISVDQNRFDLRSIFELLKLADRFLLEEIYERTLNTLISKYLCPYSAAMVYTESVKLANLQKSGCNQQLGDRSMSLMILKYILTADTLRMSERCNAIRKVFDSVVPEHVVQDLKTLINDNLYKNV